ncbi:ABC transporter substrate-binding protein [Neogemmobacter tilapiae]|uniref:ABC transporter substrate-binding protein n=1 Tax=Neogemmobacter tilapiae TaxID=875041 RepID=A0A918TY24_9RHOB|nr:ABC transporter substrate-binding protein [Gemmobacter tilapiae]GHC65422.1 ABC transporter substrate-binding protein [Gemmobacter tilapiae]
MRLIPLLLALCAALPLHAEPVTIDHRFGTTIVEATPQRIVSVGYHEQDFLYALGIAPIGVHEWFGGHPYATWEWAEPARLALGAEPQVQRGFEIDLEWVYQQQPDLILATFAPMDQTTYDQLSLIAPVVAPPAGFPDWGAPWQEELRLIARATGRADQGEAIIAKVEADLQRLAAAYPAFAGREAAVAYVNGTDLVGYGPADGSNRLMAALGFAIPPEYTELVSAAGNFAVSLERIDLFDRDVILWLAESEGRELLDALPAFADSDMPKASVWLDATETGAMSFQSPLSIPWVAEKLAPRLDQALKNRPRD